MQMTNKTRCPSTVPQRSTSNPTYFDRIVRGKAIGICLIKLRFFEYDYMDASSLGALEKFDTHDIFYCSGCKLAKFSTLSSSNSVSSSKAPFDLVHSDVWGPSVVSTKEGSRYYVLFIDDFTHYTLVYLMKRRKHRHLVETARSFLLSANVPSVFQGEPVLTATYVINRIPTEHNFGLSSFEKLYGTLPDYSSLRVFGCTCFVLKPHVERTKLSVKPLYVCFWGMVLVKRGIVVMIRSFASFVASVHNLHESESHTEAVYNPLWHGATVEELTALHQTHTWDLVPLPAGKHAIVSCWVYTIKTKSGGSIERYEARLVAKGYSQEYDMDYEETFAHVAKMTTVRTLIVVASSSQWKISQMDVKNAFLNGDLKEEVVSSPKGYLLSQSKYTVDLFDCVRMTDNMIAKIPIDAKAKYTPINDDHLPDLSLYRTMVGSLVYLTVTRPDIAYAIHIVSQFVTAPTAIH
uniref:Integrase, catalytic core n=1 Tax=Tanacetum cinerariifolium TaxID=118510 RepID=A0A6L2K3R5_TANCI|nr:integrase, catalytic core [Tanacetum cinerariifolium]